MFIPWLFAFLEGTLVVSSSFPPTSPVRDRPWPAGAKSEAYFARQCQLHRRTGYTSTQIARAELDELLHYCHFPVSLRPATAQAWQYYDRQDNWGNVQMMLYTYRRPSALDSAYHLLVQQQQACGTETDCGCFQEMPGTLFRWKHVARSAHYLVIGQVEKNYVIFELAPHIERYAALLP